MVVDVNNDLALLTTMQTYLQGLSIAGQPGVWDNLILQLAAIVPGGDIPNQNNIDSLKGLAALLSMPPGPNALATLTIPTIASDIGALQAEVVAAQQAANAAQYNLTQVQGTNASLSSALVLKNKQIAALNSQIAALKAGGAVAPTPSTSAMSTTTFLVGAAALAGVGLLAWYLNSESKKKRISSAMEHMKSNPVKQLSEGKTTRRRRMKRRTKKAKTK